MTLYALIMAGGAGSRLWPRSRSTQPKQFLPLLSDNTMVQETAARVRDLIAPDHLFVATGRDYVELVAEQLPEMPRAHIIGEPGGRGSAAGIGLGALALRRHDPDAVMLVLSADHMIRNVPVFNAALQAAVEVAQHGYLVTLGITPDEPHTGYGYIQRGDHLMDVGGFTAAKVRRFVEKPDRARAQSYLAEGGYSWNGGIFVWRVDAIMAAFQTHMPTLYAQLQEIDACGGPSDPSAFIGVWDEVENVTIDYGVLEHAPNMAVLPVDIGWNDVGDWNTLATLSGGNNENVVQADHIHVDTSGTLVYSDGARLIATIGLENFLVVDTGDALLIAPRERAQDVKKLVDQLRATGRTELL